MVTSAAMGPTCDHQGRRRKPSPALSPGSDRRAVARHALHLSPQAAGQSHMTTLPLVEDEAMPLAPPPLKRGGIGGLRPPFLALRTPMRSIGYGPLARRVGIAPRAKRSIPTRLARLRAGLGDLPFSRGGGARGTRVAKTLAQRVCEPNAITLPHAGRGGSKWRIRFLDRTAGKTFR